MNSEIDPFAPSGGQRRPPRAPKLGDTRSPVTTAVVLAAAAVAVLAGFVILGSITNDIAASSGVFSGSATTTSVAAPVATAPPSITSTTTSTTTTTVATSASKSDAVVVVANASGVGGSATAMIAELAAAGYTMAPVANATGPRLEQSIIYYLEANPAALGVAQLLAAQIPTARTLPMPQPPPLDRPLNTATVTLMLGRDAAGRSLAELQTG